MSLLYKPDWDETKDRMRRWWDGEWIGRTALAVTAPRDDPPDEPRPEYDGPAEEMWYDLDFIAALRDWEHSRTFYGGEAVPVWHGGYPGHTCHPAFLGCDVDLDYRTGWVHTHPQLAGEELDLSGLELDESTPAYAFHLRTLRRAVREAKGKSVPGVGAFGATGDTLAWLRGTERLLYDTIDRPEKVLAAELKLIEQWKQIYARCYEILRDTAEGSTCWFGVWSPGKFYAPQNDFAYMISPHVYEDLFLPALLEQLAFLDHSIYHVDGEGNFEHVDLLCGLDDLDGMQILPGAGKPSPLHYMAVLRKVQAAGKKLHITIPADEVEEALETLSARGLFIQTSCRAESDARQLLENAEKWSRDRSE